MKNLVITEEVNLCLTLLSDDADRISLINVLFDFINDKPVDEDGLYIKVKTAYCYLTASEERISKLIAKKEETNE